MRLISLELGNHSSIHGLRQLIEKVVGKPQAVCPILWTKVIHQPGWSGDYVPIEEVRVLQEEIRGLWGGAHKNALMASTEFYAHPANFFPKLQEIVDASLQVGKPIAFD